MIFWLDGMDDCIIIPILFHFDPDVPEYCSVLRADDWPVCPYFSGECRPANASAEAHNVDTAMKVWDKTLELIGLQIPLKGLLKVKWFHVNIVIITTEVDSCLAMDSDMFNLQFLYSEYKTFCSGFIHVSNQLLKSACAFCCFLW